MLTWVMTSLGRVLARRRMASLGIDPALGGGASGVAHAARHLLAEQAQDLASGQWSIGVRTGATLADVEAAVDARTITRSWPMRGTLHLMATEDVRWMCRLLNTRAEAATRARFAALDITPTVLGRARDAVIAAVEEHAVLSRPALFDVLRRCGIDPDGQRGIHLLGRFCQEALLCQGPPVDRQPSFVLLDAWAPWSWDPGREEAMAALAERYVRGHGPVTERDLAGWAGQSLGFAREAVTLAGDRLAREEIAGTAHLVHVDAPPAPAAGGLHLLPGFDEYLLGYKDRSAMLTAQAQARIVPGGNGMFLPTVVVGGQVVGTWGRRLTPTRVAVTVAPFGAVSATRLRALVRAATAYGRFLGREVDLAVAGEVA